MKFDHIAIAVKDIDKSSEMWEKLFGLKLELKTQVEHRKVKVGVLKVGNVRIELIEPMSVESPVSKFLEEQGEGLHHICFEVEDIDSILTELKNKGVKLIDEFPKTGVFAKKTVFLHPKTTGSILIEICEK